MEALLGGLIAVQRRILCARLPHLALVAAWRSFPELRGQPLVVARSSVSLNAPVVAASQPASTSGVRPGQPLRHAQRLCPAAALAPVDDAQTEQVRHDVLTALYQLSPAVESSDDEAYCDLSGRHVAFLDERAAVAAVGRALTEVLEGPAPALGVAGSRLVARLAAHVAQPGRARRVPPGEEAAFLAPLSLSLLPLDAVIISRLAAMGITRMGEAARLLPADLERQFPREGRALARWVRGEDGGGVFPIAPRTCWTERLVFEGAVSESEALRFCARRCAEALGERLSESGLVAGRVALTLELEEHPDLGSQLVPPAPAGNGAELWTAALRMLCLLDLPAPVLAVRVEVSELSAAGGRQIDMWRHADGRREAIAHTAVRLGARFGDGVVRRPRLVVDPGHLAERRFTWEEVSRPPAKVGSASR